MNEESKFLKGFLVGLIVAAASAAILIFFARDYIFSQPESETSSGSNQEEEALKAFNRKLGNAMAYIKKYYYEDVDVKVLYEGALDGMMAALGDPYSCYYNAAETEALKQATDGSYVGIGCYVAVPIDSNDIVVVSVMEDSPAEKAGLLPDDIMIAVDGRSIVDMDLNYALSFVRGVEGSQVVITIKRDNKTLDLTMTRAKIEQRVVTYKMLDDGIGYIYLAAFYKNATDEIKEALADMEKQGMQKLIIDLRDDPGGLYDTAIEVLDIMLDKGLLAAYTEDNKGKQSKSYTKDTDRFEKPLAILINGNSASASELFTQAMRDYEKATVIGTRSYGKGVYQSMYYLVEDFSSIKLTGGKYYSPKGICIHEVGIEPDIMVELDEGLEKESILKRTRDNQLDVAIEYLKTK